MTAETALNLYDATTGEYIRPAEPEHVAANDVVGKDGAFWVDNRGQIISATEALTVGWIARAMIRRVFIREGPVFSQEGPRTTP